MGRGDLPKISELGESGIGPGLWAPYGAWSISPHCLPWASPLGAASRTPAVGFLPEHPGHFLITLTIKCLLFVCLCVYHLFLLLEWTFLTWPPPCSTPGGVRSREGTGEGHPWSCTSRR